jgi:hypothetical protein
MRNFKYRKQKRRENEKENIHAVNCNRYFFGFCYCTGRTKLAFEDL